MIFRDRADAGRRLADQLVADRFQDPVVLALARGGVVVAAPIAAALRTGVIPFVVRKIGAPGHREFGIGAVAEGNDDVIVSDAASRIGVSAEALEQLAAEERSEVRRRVERYRRGRPLPLLEGRDVILVDDGLATGVTAEAALVAVRRQRPRRLVLAVPVSAPDTLARLSPLADSLLCLAVPQDFSAVGEWYERFDQTTDDEVLAIVEGKVS